MTCVRNTARYIWLDMKQNKAVFQKLKITSILDIWNYSILTCAHTHARACTRARALTKIEQMHTKLGKMHIPRLLTETFRDMPPPHTHKHRHKPIKFEKKNTCQYIKFTILMITCGWNGLWGKKEDLELYNNVSIC